jgi:LemA protein
MWILLVFIAIVLLAAVWIYNGLIARKNQVDSVFSTTDVMLKKRYDLIPQLVNTVKGYMLHERELFERITALRSRAVSGDIGSNESVILNNELTKLLGRLFMVVENYPQLKASENFMHLQRTLVELEEQIAAARRAFNAAVLDYNNAVQMFPTNIAASVMGYKRKDFFEIEDEEKKKADVKIN